MSFTKYLESKNRPRTVVVMDAYKERLNADMSALLLKPDERLVEARKNIVNIKELGRILSELAYPLADELSMAIRTGDSKKVSHSHMTFRRWADYSRAETSLVDKVETALFQYETKLHGKEFGPNEADSVVKSSIDESQCVLNRMSQNIELAISKIPNWKNHPITIEAVCPEKGWVVTEAVVHVGESFIGQFKYFETPIGFATKEFNEDGLPPSLKADMQELLSKLRQSPKFNKIVTLYMTRPLSERRHFEMAKRDLSLGISASLPNHITLANIPLSDNADVWKVRLEDKYLREYLHEGDVKQYHIIGDECPIRWIERINDEK